jgi:hypothetical protein
MKTTYMNVKIFLKKILSLLATENLQIHFKEKARSLSLADPHEDVQDRKWEGCNSPSCFWVLTRTTYLAAGTSSYGCSCLLPAIGRAHACMPGLFLLLVN